MKTRFFSSTLLFSLAIIVCGLCFPRAGVTQYRFPVSSDLIEVEIIGDNSGHLPLYTAPYGDSRESGGRWYVPAQRGERFTIEVRNRSHETVGLVISVDGRNIITGERSYLRSREGMYIIGPHRSGRYTGWRSSLREVQRFYFTEAPDSYAGAWGDYQQMGMIAVAAFRERYSRPDYPIALRDMEKSARAPTAAPTAGQSSEPLHDKRLNMSETSEAGTGYGETHYAPVREVSFEPDSFPFQRLTIRYDWYENLRRRGVIPSEPRYRHYEEERHHEGSFTTPPPR